MTSWTPTRKWLAAQVVALGALAASAIESGWDDLETKLAIGIAVQAIVTYLLPNEKTPGGAGVRRVRRVRPLYDRSVVLAVLSFIATLVGWRLEPRSEALDSHSPLQRQPLWPSSTERLRQKRGRFLSSHSGTTPATRRKSPSVKVPTSGVQPVLRIPSLSS